MCGYGSETHLNRRKKEHVVFPCIYFMSNKLLKKVGIRILDNLKISVSSVNEETDMRCSVARINL